MLRFIRICVIVGSVFCVNLVHPVEPYNITSCWSGDVIALSASKELEINSFDLKGVSRSNNENKAFDNWSFHIIGTSKMEGGNYSNFYYGKYLSPEGDIVIVEGHTTGGEGTWKFLKGTGKWQGISGGGITNIIPNIRSIKKGTSQGCSRGFGTYQLPQ
jgi:hypothetical protein